MDVEEFEKIRIGLGWTKRKLASNLGIHEVSIQDYLNGKTKSIPKPIQILMKIYKEKHERGDK